MKIITTPNELLDKDLWTKYCQLKQWTYHLISEGQIDGEERLELSLEEWIKIGGKVE